MVQRKYSTLYMAWYDSEYYVIRYTFVGRKKWKFNVLAQDEITEDAQSLTG